MRRPSLQFTSVTSVLISQREEISHSRRTNKKSSYKCFCDNTNSAPTNTSPVVMKRSGLRTVIHRETFQLSSS